MCVKMKNRVKIILFLYNIFQVALDIIRNDEIPNHKTWKNAEKKLLVKIEKGYACRITIINKTMHFWTSSQKAFKYKACWVQMDICTKAP